jgi:hypothetical protein
VRETALRGVDRRDLAARREAHGAVFVVPAVVPELSEPELTSAHESPPDGAFEDAAELDRAIS